MPAQLVGTPVPTTSTEQVKLLKSLSPWVIDNVGVIKAA